MSILEQTTFIKNIHPFDNLSRQQLEEIAHNLDIVYFKKNEIIQQNGTQPEKLYFVIKGLVQEKKRMKLSLYTPLMSFLMQNLL